MSIGQRLAKVRKTLKISQVELSKVLKCSQPNISEYEKDSIGIPISSMQIIRKTYNISLDWLLTGEGSMFLSDQKNENLNKSSSLESKEVTELQKKISDLEKEIKAIEYLNNKFEKNNKELSDELIKRLQQVADLSIKMLDLQS